jgi:hypothetical protein
MHLVLILGPCYFQLQQFIIIHVQFNLFSLFILEYVFEIETSCKFPCFHIAHLYIKDCLDSWFWTSYLKWIKQTIQKKTKEVLPSSKLSCLQEHSHYRRKTTLVPFKGMNWLNLLYVFPSPYSLTLLQSELKLILSSHYLKDYKIEIFFF